MKRLAVDGLVITIEGTWYEISNGEEVVAYGNCSEDTTPEYVYKYFKQGKA